MDRENPTMLAKKTSKASGQSGSCQPGRERFAELQPGQRLLVDVGKADPVDGVAGCRSPHVPGEVGPQAEAGVGEPLRVVG